MITTTIIMALVTMYGATGNPMANGQMPYVGAAACPRNIPLETKVMIYDVTFTCADRTAKKYDGRFDLYSEGTRKQMLRFGKKKTEVKLLTK